MTSGDERTWGRAFGEASLAWLVVAFLTGPLLCLCGFLVFLVIGDAPPIGLGVLLWITAVIIGGIGALLIGIPMSAILWRSRSGCAAFAIFGVVIGLLGGIVVALTTQVAATPANDELVLFPGGWQWFAKIGIPIVFSTGYALLFWLALLSQKVLAVRPRHGASVR